MQVQRLECREDMALGSLAVHLQTQHGKAMRGIRYWGTMPPGGEPHTYNMDFPTAGGTRNFLVKGCWGRVATRTAMRVQFFHRNVRDTVIILEEGNLPPPGFPRCNMLVPCIELNRWHISTAHCTKGAYRRCRSLAEEEMRESA